MRKYLIVLLASLFIALFTNAQIKIDLLNNSLKSIPLKIPSVMNPNLSPQSKSGVTLSVGQKIFFTYKNKKRLLLIVDESLNGKSLIVNKLIEQKVTELKAKKD